MNRFKSEEAMAKLTKAEFNHLVKEHIRADKKSGTICVSLSLQCSKKCKIVVHTVHICHYPPCPC
jgi:hypothetical protein